MKTIDWATLEKQAVIVFWPSAAATILTMVGVILQPGWTIIYVLTFFGCLMTVTMIVSCIAGIVRKFKEDVEL